MKVFEKRPGQWYIDFRDQDGTRHRLPTGESTKTAAERAAATVMANFVANRPARATVAGGPSLRDTFALALRTRESWITSKDHIGLDNIYAQLGLPDDTGMGTLTRDKVRLLREKWLQEPGKRAGTKLSPSTINHRLSMLSVLLEVADLPPHQVKHLSTKGNRRVRRITDAEINAMRVYLMGSSADGAGAMAALITAGFETAARQGELLGLAWADVAGGLATFRDTKNGETRVVPLTAPALAVLESRRKPDSTGPFNDLTTDRCTTLWARGRAALGLTDDHEFVFHGLRHERLSRLADAGMDAFTIMAIAGHANITTTQVYVKSGIGGMQRALGIAS